MGGRASRILVDVNVLMSVLFGLIVTCVQQCTRDHGGFPSTTVLLVVETPPFIAWPLVFSSSSSQDPSLLTLPVHGLGLLSLPLSGSPESQPLGDRLQEMSSLPLCLVTRCSVYS